MPTQSSYIGIILLCLLLACSAVADTKTETALKLNISGLSDVQRDNVQIHLGEISNAETKNRYSLNKRLTKGVNAGLNPLGYFSPTLSWSVADNSLNIAIEPGQPVVINKASIRLTGKGASNPQLLDLLDVTGWQKGAVFSSTAYDKAKSALLTTARQQGYLTAIYSEHSVSVRPSQHSADITLTLDTGPLFRFGQFTQAPSGISERRINTLAKWPQGDPVNTAGLNKVQKNLLGSGYFSDVTLNRSRDDEQAVVNVNALFSMTQKNRVTAGIGYGTDTGPRVKIDWERPWINRAGHSLRASGYFSAISNRLALSYIIPTHRSNGSYWELESALENSKVEDTDSRKFSSSAAYVTTLPWGWQGSAYIKYIDEQYTQGQQRGKSQLFTPGISASRKKTDDAMNPSHGYRYNIVVDGAHKSALSDASFVRANVQGKWLYSWGRHRLFSGLQLGGFYLYDHTTIADIPASLRFFAGGDTSVRGYDYRSLAPRDANGDLTGGQYLLATRLEYGYRFKENWRAALFVDAGNAFNNNGESLFVGPGVGLHWLSPVGPVRIDIGVAASNSHQIKLHIGLGPEL